MKVADLLKDIFHHMGENESSSSEQQSSISSSISSSDDIIIEEIEHGFPKELRRRYVMVDKRTGEVIKKKFVPDYRYRKKVSFRPKPKPFIDEDDFKV